MTGVEGAAMIGLVFISLMLGLWLLAMSVTERGYWLGIDVSHMDLVLGDGAARWICGLSGGALMLIGVLAVAF